MPRRIFSTIIHKKGSLPYHTYSISYDKLLSKIFSVTPWVCTHQIALKYLIHHPSSQAVTHHLKTIKSILKKVQRFLSTKRLGAGCKNIYLFTYNIDTILLNPLIIKNSPFFVNFPLINYHIHYSYTLNIQLLCHRHIFTMFLCCSLIHHIHSDHYPYNQQYEA